MNIFKNEQYKYRIITLNENLEQKCHSDFVKYWKKKIKFAKVCLRKQGW